MEELRPGCHMALAVTIGKTRLIDNAHIYKPGEFFLTSSKCAVIFAEAFEAAA
jgi:hypothetical protein